MIKKTICYLLLCVSLSSKYAWGEKLKKISIDGFVRIEALAVKDYLTIKEGDEIDAYQINESLKRLYGSGLFSNIELNVQGSTLKVKIVENPTINQVAFEGNESVSDDILKGEVQIKSRQVFTEDAVKREVQKILEIYQRKGRYAATVEPKMIRRDQNRVDVIFMIQEGSLTKIQKINFVGAQNFSQAILEDAIYSKEERWYRFFSAMDTYDSDRIETDKYALRRFYEKNGYIDFVIISSGSQLLQDKSGFLVTFMINEGQRYKVQDVAYDVKIPGLDLGKLDLDAPLIVGEYYDVFKLDKLKSLLSDKLGDLGYAFVNIEHDLEKDSQSAQVKVTFKLEEAEKIYIERIDIAGNTKTLDRVVRREVLLKEGDPFNQTKLKESLHNIRNLGYFNPRSIRHELIKGTTSNKRILKIFVSEQSEITLNLGAGYNQKDGASDFWNGFFGNIKFTDPNFCGHGINIKIETSIGLASDLFNISASDPHLFGYRLGGGGEIFRNFSDRNKVEAFTDKTWGASGHISYVLYHALSQKVTYTFSNQELKLKKDGDNTKNIPLMITEQANRGPKNTSKISLQTFYDKRDNRIDPTSGYAIVLMNDFAGLGGDVSYMKNEIKTAFHFPVMEKIVLNLRGRAGIIFADDLRITDHFMLGAESFHGFAVWGVGPRVQGKGANDEEKKKNSWPLGGKKYYTGAVEFSIPVGAPELGIKLLAYGEFGDLWDSGYKNKDTNYEIFNESFFRASVGLGIAVTVPLMGRIRLDYAVPILMNDKQDNAYSFSFGMDYKL